MVSLWSALQWCAVGMALAGAGTAAWAQTVPVAPVQKVQEQPYVWKNVKILAGGYIPNIVFSPVKKGLVYCRADIGGVYMSEDGGTSWKAMLDWSGVSNEQGGESVAPDPVDGNTVYIAAGMYSRDKATAIIRTTDGGKTYAVFPIAVTMGGNDNGRSVGERLAVDPSARNVLYFGTRHHGLWTSTNSAETWSKVESFPVKAVENTPRGGTAGYGLSFVAFDPASGGDGKPSKTIYVGSTEPGEADAAAVSHFFRSADAGKTWAAVPGEPKEFLPVRGQFDGEGNLYVVYDSAVGPGGVNNGRFWKFSTKDGKWTDISPDKESGTLRAAGRRVAGGYGGFGLDRQHPGTILIASYNRVVGDDADQLYRTTDGGKTWVNLTPKMKRDSSATPYLPWVSTRDFNIGWWISGLAIDPFDSNHAIYLTGATLMGTHELGNADKGLETHWATCVEGIEETAVRGLISPTEGPHLISVLYDLGGFTHDDLDVSPPMQLRPLFATGDSVDFAERNPKIVVRTGSNPWHFPPEGNMGYSLDGGHTWQAFAAPPLPPPATAGAGPRRRRENGGVILSADGGTFMLLTGPPQISTDRGKTWTESKGLPVAARPVADRQDVAKFCATDIAQGLIWTSADGGKSFAPGPSLGMPTTADLGERRDGGAWSNLQATLGVAGDLWITTKKGMYHSADGGKHFALVANTPTVMHLSFGMAAAGKTYPALFVAGTLRGLTAIFRSDDVGVTWVRVNDDQHQWGARFDVICGDPRIYGRVYVGTNGRGIQYGDIAK